MLSKQLLSKSMDEGETKYSSSYGKPPWIFKGRQVSDDLDFIVYYYTISDCLFVCFLSGNIK